MPFSVDNPPIGPSPAQIVRHDALRKQAETFVAQSFFAPMFKQMRDSPFKSELFSGGSGGEMFQTMLDGQLSQRMGRSAAKPLVDAIVRKLDPEVARYFQRTRISGGAVPTLITAPTSLPPAASMHPFHERKADWRARALSDASAPAPANNLVDLNG